MIEIQTYPLSTKAHPEQAYQSTIENFAGLLNLYHLRKERKLALLRQFGEYFACAERLFDQEEEDRLQGKEGANLFYHGKPHAVFQAAYDGISVARGILERKDKMSSHLSLESSLAIVIGSMFHDSGYVTGIEGNCDNYAARTPVHVGQGMETVKNVLDDISFPRAVNSKPINLEKVKRLSILGIHSTHFPFTPQRKHEMRQLIYSLPTPEIKEAFIVALGVRLADLGGQVARRDYIQTLPALREEINAANPGMGYIVIGKDEELAVKCAGFIEAMVLPTVGKIANAFFGKNNAFQKSWGRHLLSSKTNPTTQV